MSGLMAAIKKVTAAKVAAAAAAAAAPKTGEKRARQEPAAQQQIVLHPRLAPEQTTATARGPERELGELPPVCTRTVHERSRTSCGRAVLRDVIMPGPHVPGPHRGAAIKERKRVLNRKACATYRAKPDVKERRAKVSSRPGARRRPRATPPPRPRRGRAHAHPTLARPHADPYATAPLGRPRTPPTTLHLCAPQKDAERMVSHPLNDTSPPPRC